MLVLKRSNIKSISTFVLFVHYICIISLLLNVCRSSLSISRIKQFDHFALVHVIYEILDDMLYLKHAFN